MGGNYLLIPSMTGNILLPKLHIYPFTFDSEVHAYIRSVFGNAFWLFDSYMIFYIDSFFLFVLMTTTISCQAHVGKHHTGSVSRRQNEGLFEDGVGG